MPDDDDPPIPWLVRARAAADRPPDAPREALFIGPAECGSIEVSLARTMCDAGLPLRRQGGAWILDAPPDAALAGLARWLHGQGLSSAWRDELMAVTGAGGETHGVIERAAVRRLGITTFAVHLVGWTESGAVWVQQRALDKATDPGRWDTLMGGLASARETTAQTLERETWEEAGLRSSDLRELAPMGRITVRRPVWEGYMVEHIDTFEACVPQGAVPVNQDGEVERFECIDAATLLAWLEADRFTLEASLIHAHWLRRRGLL